MATMHSTRTVVLAMLVALLLPAPTLLAETAPTDRSKTAGRASYYRRQADCFCRLP
jgi:hypothetical protein